MIEQFRFISKRTKKIEYRTLLKKELRFCQNKKCRKFIDPNEMAKPIDYSSYSVKLAKQIKDATECVTSKTVVLDSLSWHPEKL